MQEANEGLAGGVTAFVSEYRFRRADGRYAAVLARSSIIRDAEGQAVRAIGALLDLSERKQAEEALRVSEERLQLAARASGLGIADYDLVTGDVHWSPELREMVGISADAPISWDMVRQTLDPDNEQNPLDDHDSAVRGERGHVFSGTYLVIRPTDNSKHWHATETAPIYNDEGTAVRLVTTVRDITEEKTAQDRINWIATHDSITGLANRHAFQTAFDAAVERAREKGEQLSLILIDLDNFKYVNDTLGHEAGDATLSAFAERLGKVIPSGATAARFGGDEFAVILPQPPTGTPTDITAAIQKAVQPPFAIAGRSVILRVSIGVSNFPAHGAVASELVQSADMALYAAKAAGRSGVRTFEPALRAVMQREVSMLSQARAAVANGWIEPHYQPKIELGTGRVVGFEALLRWRHPGVGLQPPDTIASAFDDVELSGLIGEAMIDAVLQDLRQWQASGLPVSKIAINASAAEFGEAGYAEHLQSRLAVHGIAADAIEVEITETALLSDRVDIVLGELTALRAAGVTVALDDFGTGFSSLSHLRQFPVDKLKVDRSFVAGIGESDGDGAIVEAVVRLGRALGMEIVAEGVETRQQAEFLNAIGCQTAQGFLYSPALPAADIPGFLAASSAGTPSDPERIGGGMRTRTKRL
jgi:diguanylate cyclase (GGDEF)-like protein/PAS domain S-box-containing protein